MESSIKLIILAAGYATRLYPLTLKTPKPLLPVAGRPIIEYVMESLTVIPQIDEVIIVSNGKFANHFEQWAKDYLVTNPKAVKIRIVNDQSTDDTNKLGAIGDLNLVINQGQLKDDIIVVAGDNLFNRTLESFGEFILSQKAPVLGVYDVEQLELVKKYCSIHVNEENRITRFEEKPSQPTSTMAGIALYYYPKDTLPMIRRYVEEGNNPDQPGRLVQWLYPQIPVYSWAVPGIWYDIGSKETLEEANRIFSDQSTA